MYGAVVILSALAAVAFGQTTPVTQCTGSSGELPINAYISGCEATPCSLPQLQDAVINIVFRAPRNMRTMTTRAVAYLPILPIPIPYDLGNNALTCNFLENTYCPVLEGEIMVYTLYMYIEAIFPVGIAPTVEFWIEDDNNDSIMCIRVPIMIAPASARAANATATALKTNTEAQIDDKTMRRYILNNTVQ